MEFYIIRDRSARNDVLASVNTQPFIESLSPRLFLRHRTRKLYTAKEAEDLIRESIQPLHFNYMLQVGALASLI